MIFKSKSKFESVSDAELVECYKNSQNKEYVDELFQRYATLVFGVAMKYLKDEDKSKDITMSVFEKLFTELIRRSVNNFKPWLYQVTKNEVLMLLRKQKSTQSKEQAVYQEEKDSFMEFDDYSHLLSNERNKEKLLTQLEDCIQHLKPEQKVCVEQFYLDQKCYQEVADSTSFEIKKVKSYIQNGKRNLKICLEKSL